MNYKFLKNYYMNNKFVHELTNTNAITVLDLKEGKCLCDRLEVFKVQDKHYFEMKSRRF